MTNNYHHATEVIRPMHLLPGEGVGPPTELLSYTYGLIPTTDLASGAFMCDACGHPGIDPDRRFYRGACDGEHVTYCQVCMDQGEDDFDNRPAGGWPQFEDDEDI